MKTEQNITNQIVKAGLILGFIFFGGSQVLQSLNNSINGYDTPMKRLAAEAQQRVDSLDNADQSHKAMRESIEADKAETMKQLATEAEALADKAKQLLDEAKQRAEKSTKEKPSTFMNDGIDEAEGDAALAAQQN